MIQPDANTPNPPAQHSDFFSDLKTWWHTCPLFTRFLIYTCSTLCILSIFSYLPSMLVNKPTYTIGQFQITRLIFSPFVFYTVLQAIFAFATYLPVCAQQEKENGTLRTMIDFVIKNLEINVIFVILCYFFASISKWFLTLEAYGLWSIFFIQIVEKCLINPEDTTTFLLPSFRLQNKIYPVVLFVIFTVITNAFRLDMIAAGIAGFLNLRFFNVAYHERFNQEKMVAWESNSLVAWLRTLPHFVSLSSISGPLLAEQDREYNPNYSPIGATAPKRNSNPNLFGDDGIPMEGFNKNKANAQRTDYEKPQIEI